MKRKRVLTFGLGLVLLLASSACSRNDVGTPSPVGPSSFAVLLKLSASRNVIYAGEQRDRSTISVSLKQFNGAPLTGRTVYFEICDSAHLRVDVGYFEGMERVISRQTDSGGNITFVYHGPLNSEIAANTSVYIWASAASEGNEFIEDFAQVNIVRDSSSAGVLEISADPNVIFASTGGHREYSRISVSLKRLDGTPLAGRKIYFEICDSTHVQLEIGFFEGGDLVLSRKTDAGGNISFIYFGPLRSELPASTSVYIYATVASEGDEFTEGFTQIKIISDR